MACFYTAALNAIHNSILFGLQICAFNAIRNSQFHTLWPSELYFGNLGWFLMWMSHKCTFCAFEICTFGIRGGFCGVHMLSDPSNETHALLLNPLVLVLFGLPPCAVHLSTTPDMRVFHPSPNVSELNCHNKITKFHQAPLPSCLTLYPAALPNFEELKLKASVRVRCSPKQLTGETVAVFIAAADVH